MNPGSGNEVKESAVSKIGFYDLERTIGKGNFAVVRLARHRITKSHVAIKIINKSKLDPVNLKKMHREIQIMQLINHPQIIKLYQVIDTKTMLYLVTEYAENGELFDFISKYGRMSENSAKTVFGQIGSAVKYLHENKIVHRDLKTENLLFETNNRVKLVDFGFANFYSEKEKLSTWCGSPPYAAPEVFEGLKYQGPEIDIWSLGVILYVLVCGFLPFSGDTLQNLRDHVLSCHFRVPYYVTTVCEDLIRRMLVRNPMKRVNISDVLRHEWLDGAICPEWQQSPPPVTSDQRDDILRVMQSLGISSARVLQSVEDNAFDNYSSMYHLLAERLRGRLRRSDGLIRRPSSLAEQAIEQATASFQVSHLVSSPTPQNSCATVHSPFTTVGSNGSANSGAMSTSSKAVSSSGFGSSFEVVESPVCGVSSSASNQQQHLANFTLSQQQQQSDVALAMLYHQQTKREEGNQPETTVNEQQQLPSFHPPPHLQVEQKLFPGSLQHQNHQYLSATSVPNSATAQQPTLAALNPLFDNASLLPASYYGAFVLQQLQQLQQQQSQQEQQQRYHHHHHHQQQQQQHHFVNPVGEIPQPNMAQFTQPMHLAYRRMSGIPSNMLELLQYREVQKLQQDSFTSHPFAEEMSGAGCSDQQPLMGPGRPPLLKRASLPADVLGSLSNALTSAKAVAELQRQQKQQQQYPNMSFSHAAGSDYAQHSLTGKSRRYVTSAKSTPYRLPTQQFDLPCTSEHSNVMYPQRIVFMPSLSCPKNNTSGGSTTQLQVATELLTIKEDHPASSSSSYPNQTEKPQQPETTPNGFAPPATSLANS